jgi:tRNA pseudouridine38-40 synthase
MRGSAQGGQSPRQKLPGGRVGRITPRQTVLQPSERERLTAERVVPSKSGRGTESPQRRLALLVEYQGTAYGGSQLQKSVPTVQGALERALSSLTDESIRVALAGRTDAGTHAKGQVASFVTGSWHSAATFARALNALLPADIGVRDVAEVPLAFDPRRQALGRRYRYTLHLGSQRPALLRHFVWHLSAALDLETMTEAATCLIGRHDFAAFTQPSEARRRSTERVVAQTALRARGQLAIFDIEANAFLPQMVRRIVGALVEVGSGSKTQSEFEALVRDAQPGAARKVAPARGLCLMKVRYDDELFDDRRDAAGLH